jgi:hypothetical protein
MNISPQPGDHWSLQGEHDIEVVSVTPKRAFYKQGGTASDVPLAEFERLARNSLKRGAVLHRGGETFSPLEGFEV